MGHGLGLTLLGKRSWGRHVRDEGAVALANWSRTQQIPSPWALAADCGLQFARKIFKPAQHNLSTPSVSPAGDGDISILGLNKQRGVASQLDIQALQGASQPTSQWLLDCALRWNPEAVIRRLQHE